ncbi:Protein YIPF3 [Acropora cervicornis]|uniref:Protein YIPF3 n=1 Tax=Acropora cervicornis TaxID=6130 RepID=A0AAD9VBD7_ACRCE|nr:Protein YIPF3 [Acropora cervicornis]
MATLGDEDKSSSASSESRSSSWYYVQDNTSAVIDIANTDDLQSEPGNGESFSPEGSPGRQPVSETEFMEKIRERMAQEVGGYVWQAGKQSAKRAFDLYANIDILRPYFDVEPIEVRNRLLNSLIPRFPSTASPQTVVGELYGPLMLVFTLIAILLFSMKSSGHTVQEGTLMGTAVGVCFGYWIGGSAFFYSVSFVCNTHLTFLQILSLSGYALFGNVVCLFLTTIGYHHSHSFFYALWLVFGGLSAAKLVTVFMSRTFTRRQGLIAGCVVATVHLLFLLYLHFAYHSVYEEYVDQTLSRHSREVFTTSLQNMVASPVQKRVTETYQVVSTPHRFKRSINASKFDDAASSS